MNNDKIDRRIVEMSFENQKFEKGISQSKNSLQQFSNALKNADVVGGFSGLDKVIGFMSHSFSSFEQIAIGGLRRIGESAVNAGAQLVKSLTIGQITGGFTEYELKMNTIRAIMNSTGSEAVDVREKLKSLDDYADKTIFSTRDMFDNLATFTNAGIPLEKATKAMIGIANATAYAGQDANAAMYAYRNFSDAISNGFMSLMDWRSISRVAKIGTQEFRQEILKTAVELGTLSQAQIDSGEVTTQFEDTLQEQWMTADVVTAVLNKYGDATTEVGAKAWKAAQEVRTFSGMMESLKASIGTQFANMSELIFGDLEEAKRNFTFLNAVMTTVFTSGVKSANNMLAGVKELGGIENVFEGLKNITLALLSILKPITQAFDEIFPPKTKQQWVVLTKIFKDFTASLLIADSTGDKIRRTFAGLFAVIDISWQLVKFLANAVFELFKIFVPLGDGILDTSASLGDFLVKVDKAIKSSQIFQYAMLTIKAVVVLLRDELSRTISIIKEFIIGLWNAEDPLEYLRKAGENVFSGFIAGIKMVAYWLSEKLPKAIKNITKFFNMNFDETVVGIWPTILSALKEVVEFITGEATNGFKSFGEAINSLNFNKIATFVVGGVILMFVKQLSDLTGAMAGFTNSLSSVVKGFSKKFFTSSQAGVIREIAITIGVLAASIWLLSKIPAPELEKALKGLAVAIGIFVVAYALIQAIIVASHNLTNNDIKQQATSAFGLVGVAAALLVMAAGIQIISKIHKDDIWRCVGVLGAIFVMITGYQVLSVLISKLPGQQKVNTNLLAMSVAVSLLIGSLLLLKYMTLSDIKSSLGKLAIIMLVVTGLEGIFALTARVGRGNKLSAGILQMALGITAMIATLKLLTFIDQGTIKQGLRNLTFITLVIAGVELVMGLVGRISGGKKVHSNILSIEIGMLAMIGLVAIVGNKKYMTSEVLDQGITNLAKLAGLVVGIQLMTALSARIAGGNKVQKILGSVTVTMLAFTGIIAIVGNMPQVVIDQGIMNLKTMIGLVSSIQLMTVLASKIGGGINMFASLIGIAIAIATLTGALSILSIGDQEALRKAVISLTIGSGAILILSFAIQKIIPAINKISKGSKGFIVNVKKVVFGLFALGAILVATGGFFFLLGTLLPIIKQIDKKDFIIFTLGFIALSTVFMAVNIMGKQLTNGQFSDKLNGLKAGFLALGGILLMTASFFGLLGFLLPDIKKIAPKDFAIFVLGLGVMTGLLFAVNLMGKRLNDLQFSDQLNGIKAGLFALGAILIATAGFFFTLSQVLTMPGIKDLTVKDLAIFTFGLTIVSALVLSYGHLGKQLTKGDFGKQFGGLASGFLALGGILLLTAGFFFTLSKILAMPGIKDLTTEEVGMFVLAIGGVALIIGGIAVLGKAFKALASGWLAVLEGIVVAIVGVGLIVLATVGLALLLNKLLSNSKDLIQGLDLLAIIGAGIGRFVGSILGGIGGGAIEAMGISIAKFSQSLNTVSFSPSALQGIKDLAAAIFIITGTTLIDGLVRLTNFGVSSMELFGDQLSGLIDALNKISVDKANSASLILAAMTPMADGLKDFATAAKDVPASGGFIQDFFGAHDIGLFGKALSAFVDAFTNITVLQADHMTKVLEAMKPMVENLKLFANAAQGIPNSDGTLAKWIGDNKIDAFGRDLVRMVAAFCLITPMLATYASNVLLAMTPMINNLKEFATAADEIPETGGFITRIFGDNTVDGFGLQLTNLISMFGGLDDDLLKLAIANLQTMNDTMLPNLKTFSEFGNSLDAFDNFSLSDFANDFATFVTKLSGIDFTVVAPAMRAMDTVKASFQVLGATVLENAKESFKNNKEPFQALIVSILSEPIEKIGKQKDIIISKLTSIFKAVVDKSVGYVTSFKTLGQNIIDGLILGIESRRPTAVAITKNVMSSIIFGAYKTVESRSPSKVFERLGEYCTLGLAQGIKGKTDVAVKASTNMAKAADEAVRNTLGIHSNADTTIDSGEYFGGGFGEGVVNTYSDVKNAVKKLATDATTTLNDGIQNGMPDIFEMVQGKLGAANIDINKVPSDGLTGFVENIQKALTGDLGALVTAATGSGKAIGGAFNSSLNGESGIGGAVTKAKTEIEKLKELLDERNFYGTINLNEELAMYQQLRKKYKEGSEERKQIDREIYTRLKTIYDAQISYIEGVKKANSDAEAEKKKLKDDYDREWKTEGDAADKLEAEVNAKHDKDIFDTQVDADKRLGEENASFEKSKTSLLERSETERQRLREQYAQDQRYINEKLLSDIDNQNQAYESAVKSRADSIASSYGLFTAVGPDTKSTGAGLLRNLQSQTKALDEWKNSLTALEGRGVGATLIEEIQAMGPSSKAQVKALLTLTDEQLTEYVSLFESKYSFARTKAEEELVGLKDSTAVAIQGLNTQAAIDLSSLASEFTKSMALIDSNMAIDMEELRTTHNDAITKINSDLAVKLGEIETTWKESNKKILDDLWAKRLEMDAAYAASLTKIDTDLKASITGMETLFNSTMKTLKGLTETELLKMTAAFTSGGVDAAKGFAAGLKSSAYLVTNATAALARGAVTIARNILDEQSPSKVFEAIGKFVSMGFANGITNYAHQAEKASEEMARGPIAALSQALANMEESNDLSFTITPVIDLSALRSTDLYKFVNTPVNLGATSGKLAGAAIQNGSREKAQSTSSVNPQPTAPTISLIQNNYSPTALSRLDIYRQTRNQLSTMKGLVGT